MVQAQRMVQRARGRECGRRHWRDLAQHEHHQALEVLFQGKAAVTDGAWVKLWAHLGLTQAAGSFSLVQLMFTKHAFCVSALQAGAGTTDRYGFAIKMGPLDQVRCALCPAGCARALRGCGDASKHLASCLQALEWPWGPTVCLCSQASPPCATGMLAAN